MREWNTTNVSTRSGGKRNKHIYRYIHTYTDCCYCSWELEESPFVWRCLSVLITTLSFSDMLLLAACFLGPENLSPCRAGSQQVAPGWHRGGTRVAGPGDRAGWSWQGEWWLWQEIVAWMAMESSGIPASPCSHLSQPCRLMQWLRHRKC